MYVRFVGAAIRFTRPVSIRGSHLTPPVLIVVPRYMKSPSYQPPHTITLQTLIVADL